MRQLSVIIVVTLVVAGQAFAGTAVATDPPDVRLLTGTSLPGAFDLNDYFTGSVADGSVDIAGSADVGVRTEDFSVDGQTISSVVKVSSFLVQNGPAIDPVGAGGGNPFVNVLRPGVAVNSVQALVGAPGGGGGGSPSGGSPGGVSGPAWWITFGSVATSYNEGLRVRNTTLIAKSEGPSLSNGGLTASIGPDGGYTLTATDAFEGPVLVTFISGVGNDLDGATVLASKGLSVGDNYAGNDEVKQVEGQVVYSAVNVGSGPVTLSVDCTPSADGQVVALAALDAPGGSPTFADLAYVNPSGDSKAGVKMTLSLSYTAPSGTIVPLVMAVGGTAQFENLAVYKAPAIADLAIGANELPLTSGLFSTTGPVVDGNLNGVTDISVLSPNAPNSAPGTAALSTENNFGASGVSVALGEAGAGYDNVTLVAAPSVPGSIAGRVWVKGSGVHVDFVLTALKNFAAQTAIGQTRVGDFANWTPISVDGQVLDADMVWATVQGVGGGDGSLLVDDLKVMQVQDLDAYFDADLYAL